MLYIYSYNRNSQGAKALARTLNIKRIRHQSSRFHPSPNRTLINWGATDLPLYVQGCQIINSTLAIQQASNKLNFFRTLKEINPKIIPHWTIEREVA